MSNLNIDLIKRKNIQVEESEQSIVFKKNDTYNSLNLILKKEDYFHPDTEKTYQEIFSENIFKRALYGAGKETLKLSEQLSQYNITDEVKNRLLYGYTFGDLTETNDFKIIEDIARNIEFESKIKNNNGDYLESNHLVNYIILEKKTIKENATEFKGVKLSLDVYTENEIQNTLLHLFLLEKAPEFLRMDTSIYQLDRGINTEFYLNMEMSNSEKIGVPVPIEAILKKDIKIFEERVKEYFDFFHKEYDITDVQKNEDYLKALDIINMNVTPEIDIQNTAKDFDFLKDIKFVIIDYDNNPKIVPCLIDNVSKEDGVTKVLIMDNNYQLIDKTIEINSNFVYSNSKSSLEALDTFLEYQQVVSTMASSISKIDNINQNKKEVEYKHNER